MLDTLVLNKPLIFFDLETTGKNVATDRIIELCAIKVKPDKTRTELVKRFNPLIPIEPDATKAHGITDDMVKHEPTFAASLNEILAFFKGCDFAGYNILKFDVPMFVEELLRNGATDIVFEDARFVDCMSIYFKKETRSLSDAIRFYVNEDIVDAHSAKGDVEATIKVLNGQLGKYADLSPDIDYLNDFSNNGRVVVDYAGKFSRNKNNELVFTFGQHKDERLLDNKDYLKWMAKGDFPLHTTHIAVQVLNGKLV